jgi:lambda family phage tail tape measure protein
MGVRTSELSIIIRARDRASKTYKKLDRATQRFTKKARARFDRLKKSVFSLRGAFVGLAGAAVLGKVSKAFIKTASDVENMQVALESLLGSAEEGKKLFADLAKFAGKVPFELGEIMKVGTMFAGTIKGGRREIMKLMPLVADLGATVRTGYGIPLEQTASQLNRMFSAGAAAADMFRERGVSAMLGFKQGAIVSAEDTKKRIIAAWEDTGSQFRGTADRMAKTWTGKLSMISDRWFMFKKKVMEAGVFEFLKIGAEKFLERMGGLEEAAPKVASAIIVGLEKAVILGAMAADGYQVLKKAALAFAEAVVRGRVAIEDVASLDWIEDAAIGLTQLLVGKEKTRKAIMATAAAHKFRSTGVKELTKAEEALIEIESIRVRNAEQSFSVLEKARGWIDDIREAVEAATTAQEKAGRPPGVYTADEVEKMNAAAEAGRGQAEAAAKVGFIQKELIENYQVLRQFEKERLDDAGKINDKLREQRGLIRQTLPQYQEMQAQFENMASIVGDSIVNAMGAAIDGTFKWRAALRGLLKDLALAIARMLIMRGIGAIGTAIGSAPSMTASAAWRPMAASAGSSVAFGKGGTWGWNGPRAAKGLMFNGPQIHRGALVGEAGPEAALPLAKDADGVLGVRVVGGGGGGVTVNITDPSPETLRMILMGDTSIVAGAMHQARQDYPGVA